VIEGADILIAGTEPIAEQILVLGEFLRGNPKIALNSYAENLPKLLAKASLVVDG